MKVVFATLGVDIGVAGVFLFGSLMVSFQRTGTSLLLGKPHDCVLGYGITPSSLVEKLKAVLLLKGIGVLPASV